MSAELERLIKAPKAKVVRRAYIKRRMVPSGQFEDDWVEITNDVISFGKLVSKVDDVRPYKFTFGNVKLVVNNKDGKYHGSDRDSSLWFGYLNQQRTLIKIECAFQKVVNIGNGRKAVAEYPGIAFALWDVAKWDNDDDLWDRADIDDPTIFTGVISGDPSFGDDNKVTFNIRPLQSVFEDFPAKELTGYNGAGMTASEFIVMLRDQQDGDGNYIFRPFFGNTTAGFEFSTTSNVYINVNTQTADDVYTQSCWALIEKMAEAEGFVPYVTRLGTFRFISSDNVATSTSFEFHGAGSFSPRYGHTIKQVSDYGFKVSKYYSRVRLKWNDADTTTSYAIFESSTEVNSNSTPWVLGDRTLDLSNNFFSTLTAAQASANTIYQQVSALKNEIKFSSSLVLGLDVFTRVSIFYDPVAPRPESLWDQQNWAEDVTNSTSDLIWDKVDSSGIYLNGQEFKFLSFEIDLDNLQNNYTAREV